jgi:hypothetical protein
MDQSKEACRDARGVGPLENTLRDITYSLRVLLKSYAFTIVVAKARDVFTLIVGRGMKLTVIGVLIGVGGAIALTRLMHSLLFHTSADRRGRAPTGAAEGSQGQVRAQRARRPWIGARTG